MSTLDLALLLKSPCLPDIVATLSDHLHTEAIARAEFRDEMSDDLKVECVGQFSIGGGASIDSATPPNLLCQGTPVGTKGANRCHHAVP